MAERKIVSANTLSKTKTKSSKKSLPKVDLEKVKDFVVENKDTIEKVVSVASELMSTSSKKTTKSTGKKSTKKNTRKTSKKGDSLSSVLDIAGSLFKK